MSAREHIGQIGRKFFQIIFEPKMTAVQKADYAVEQLCKFF